MAVVTRTVTNSQRNVTQPTTRIVALANWRGPVDATEALAGSGRDPFRPSTNTVEGAGDDPTQTPLTRGAHLQLCPAFAADNKLLTASPRCSSPATRR